MASAAKNAKNVEASKARADREKGKPVKRGRGPGKKKGADADADAIEEEEFEAEEEAAPAAGKSKAKEKAGTGGGRRPVLMPLDLRTQKTLQAVARECAMEDVEEAEAPVVVKEEEPVGLLARLLKARGEEGFSSSTDFFASLGGASPKAEPAAPEAPPAATMAKGAKRGKAADDGEKP